jgi:hypothetical protein
MRTVIETPTFLRHAKAAGATETERLSMILEISANPILGDLIIDTGGVRKVRFAGRGKGKSGGYRVFTCYVADDVPVLLLALISKGETGNLSKAERNALRDELAGFVDDYRAGARQEARRRTKE